MGFSQPANHRFAHWHFGVVPQSHHCLCVPRWMKSPWPPCWRILSRVLPTSRTVPPGRTSRELCSKTLYHQQNISSDNISSSSPHVAHFKFLRMDKRAETSNTGLSSLIHQTKLVLQYKLFSRIRFKFIFHCL